MDQIFFSGWESLLRTLLVGPLAYIVLVLMLRVSGKRTLSKMNAFDLIVTVALGSTLATALLTKDVALADGALAFALLIGLQFVLAWSSLRVPWIRHLVADEPHMLLYRGKLLEGGLRRARMGEDEVLAALRASGLRSLDAAEAVVLETDGSLSVVRRDSGDGDSTLAKLR